MPKAKKFFKIAALCVVAAILCAVIYAVAYTAVVKAKDPRGVAMPFGYGATLVLSGSMEPRISTDDLVFVKRAGELNVGDVVLYNTGKSNVLHRIIEIDGDTVVTKGDANNTNDKPFSKSAVLGVYIGKLPGGGKIVRFITNPPFVMAVVFVLMVFAVIWMFADEKKEEKRLNKIKSDIEKLKAEIEQLKKDNG